MLRSPPARSSAWFRRARGLRAQRRRGAARERAQAGRRGRRLRRGTQARARRQTRERVAREAVQVLERMQGVLLRAPGGLAQPLLHPAPVGNAQAQQSAGRERRDQPRERRVRIGDVLERVVAVDVVEAFGRRERVDHPHPPAPARALAAAARARSPRRGSHRPAPCGTRRPSPCRNRAARARRACVRAGARSRRSRGRSRRRSDTSARVFLARLSSGEIQCS